MRKGGRGEGVVHGRVGRAASGWTRLFWCVEAFNQSDINLVRYQSHIMHIAHCMIMVFLQHNGIHVAHLSSHNILDESDKITAMSPIMAALSHAPPAFVNSLTVLTTATISSVIRSSQSTVKPESADMRYVFTTAPVSA